MTGETPEQQWNRLQREYQSAVQASILTPNAMSVPERMFSEIWQPGRRNLRIWKRIPSGTT